MHWYGQYDGLFGKLYCVVWYDLMIVTLVYANYIEAHCHAMET